MGASRDAELGSRGEEEEARVSKPPRPHKESPVSAAAHFVLCFSTSRAGLAPHFGSLCSAWGELNGAQGGPRARGCRRGRRNGVSGAPAWFEDSKFVGSETGARIRSTRVTLLV